MESKKKYDEYRKFDVVYIDCGKNPHGVEGGLRPAIIVSCDASNHKGGPQVTVLPLSSKLKKIPVHVKINPKDVAGYGLSAISDCMPENIQTFAKSSIRSKCGYIPSRADKREEIDRALIRQLDLMPIARKMVEEEKYCGQQIKEDE